MCGWFFLNQYFRLFSQLLWNYTESSDNSFGTNTVQPRTLFRLKSFLGIKFWWNIEIFKLLSFMLSIFWGNDLFGQTLVVVKAILLFTRYVILETFMGENPARKHYFSSHSLQSVVLIWSHRVTCFADLHSVSKNKNTWTWTMKHV